MTSKELILSELAYNYGMSKEQVEDLIYLALKRDSLLMRRLKMLIQVKLKGDK